MRPDQHPSAHRSPASSQGTPAPRDLPLPGGRDARATQSRAINGGETLAALVVLALGIFVAWEGSAYRIGSVTRMGPGFVPLLLGLILIGLGIGLVLGAVRAKTPAPRLPLRAFAAVMGAIIVFALLAERFGLVPATIGLVVLASLAERPLRPWTVALAAILLSAVGVLVFIHIFNMPLAALDW